MRPTTKLYILIATLAITALVITYFLIPSKEEVALAQLKSNRLIQAASYYKEQYQKGVRTPDIVLGLSSVYETDGELNKAIEVMEDYVHHHPSDLLALKRLADLYQENEQYAKYYQALIKYQSMSPSFDADVAHALEGYFQSIDDEPDLVRILSELIVSGKANESDYYQLAYYYASKKKYEKAALLLEARRHFFPTQVLISDIFLEDWLYIKLSKIQKNKDLQKKVVQITADYLIQSKKPLDIYFTLSNFQVQYPSLAPELLKSLSPIEPIIQKHPHLEAQALRIQLGDPKEKNEAIGKLIDMMIDFKLSDPSLQNLAFDTFLQLHDDRYVIDLIRSTPTMNINQQGVFDLAITALQREDPKVVKVFMEVLGPQYLEEHPVVAVWLEIAAGEEDAQEKLVNIVKTMQLGEIDRYYLFRIAVQAQYNKEALAIGESLYPYSGLTSANLIELAVGYAHLNKAEELYERLEKVKDVFGEGIVNEPILVLDIALHRSLKVAEWLDHEKTVSDEALSAFFSVANENKEYPLALYVAKKRMESHPSPEVDADYALALVENDKIDAGLERLKELLEANPDYKSIELDYFAALVMAVKIDPRYKEDLLAYMLKRESRGPLPKNIMKDFMYTYLDVLHDFHHAERLLEILAENAPAKSDEVQTLVFLWGPHPGPARTAWIEERAKKSTPEELIYWLQNLNFIGKEELTVQLFQKQSPEPTDPKALFAYMDALAYLKRKEELRQAVYFAFPLLKEVKQFETLAAYAEEAEDLEALTLIKERIVSLKPEDPKAWQQLAGAFFDQHDYCAALDSLQNFFSLTFPETYKDELFFESMYQYSEILRKKRSFEQADNFAQLAINTIDHAKEKTVKMVEVETLLYSDLDAHETALGYMDRLYQMTSRDPNTAAAYANMLMDRGHFHEARRFIEIVLNGTPPEEVDESNCNETCY